MTFKTLHISIDYIIYEFHFGMVNRVLKSVFFKKVLVCKGENYCFRVLTEWKEILKLFFSDFPLQRNLLQGNQHVGFTGFCSIKIKGGKEKHGQVSKQIKKY